MASKQKRLGKLAGDLNIGISKIVEIFHLNGIHIEANPNSKVNIEDVELITKYLDSYEEIKLKLEKSKELETQKIQTPKTTTYSTLIKIKQELGEPTSLYKYYGTDEYALDSLKNNYLYHSYFLDFNDPFDCNPYLIDIVGKENRKTRELFKETLNRSMLTNGICCFTRNFNSILMWSHYANKHQGICLEFNKLEGQINTFDIHYTRNFKKPDLFIDKEEALYHLIYTKSDSWKYERELRSFLKVESNEINSRKIKYNPQSLKAIYFGVRSEDSFMQQIKEIAIEKNPKIKFYRGKLKQHEFGIDWVQIKK
jgi:hypothetical protein